MSHDHQHAAPLPPDTDDREDIIRTQPPDQHAAAPDEPTSPLPPDPRGQEDIMSADPQERTRPGR